MEQRPHMISVWRRDGCLTFMFYSDLIESAPGWEADIKAIKRLENDRKMQVTHIGR